jgi:hypothetical protein
MLRLSRLDLSLITGRLVVENFSGPGRVEPNRLGVQCYLEDNNMSQYLAGNTKDRSRYSLTTLRYALSLPFSRVENYPDSSGKNVKHSELSLPLYIPILCAILLLIYAISRKGKAELGV